MKAEWSNKDSIEMPTTTTSDYIKREDAIGVLMETIAPPSIMLDTLTMRMDNIPSVDVVRCKDCKWFNLNKWAEVDGVQIIVGHEICDFWGGGCKTQEDGYCSYGEREEHE